MNEYDLVCFSHLRWDFVYQRPQHLMSRFARERRTFFVEEPVFEDGEPQLEIRHGADALWVVTPHLAASLTSEEAEASERVLIDGLFGQMHMVEFVLWYYTPMALGFSDHLAPVATVYDCMDELTAFLYAPAALTGREEALFERADLVFTGGPSLYEAKRRRHARVHLFPSSVDVAHFAQARNCITEPIDQADIPRPRLGFFGVVDERLDRDLLAEVAVHLRPDWEFVMIGPVVKIDPTSLPRSENIHYLGRRSYSDLPAYIAGWDVALLPFARSAATRFISPTKILEYLAAGCPTVSTSIQDVVHPYADLDLVSIADEPEAFAWAAADAMAMDRQDLHHRADAYLTRTSWDKTWQQMVALITSVLRGRDPPPTPLPHIRRDRYEYRAGNG